MYGDALKSLMIPEIGKNDHVLFWDKDGNYHEIDTLAITRVPDYGRTILLIEDVKLLIDKPCRLSEPPKELMEFINNWEEKK